jgi:phosphoglycerate dehydrogenase-like enzyme
LLLVTNLALRRPHVQAIQATAPDLELVLLDGCAPSAFASYADRIEVAFVAMQTDPDLVRAMPNLCWLHTTAAGVDHWHDSGLLDGPFVLTTSRGIHRLPMAEHILCTMLMSAHRMPQLIRQQFQRVWDTRGTTSHELGGKTLGVVSLGSIGMEAARRASAFSMRVLGTRRTVGPADIRARPDFVDALVPARDLTAVLAESDFLLLSVPLTRESVALVGEAELRSMKQGSMLINISRGSIVDERALIRALTEGWIGGAALDVFETEPLPRDSPLWELPNVIITPHISGGSERYLDRAVDLFVANLRRYLARQPLENVYQPERGY